MLLNNFCGWILSKMRAIRRSAKTRRSVNSMVNGVDGTALDGRTKQPILSQNFRCIRYATLREILKQAFGTLLRAVCSSYLCGESSGMREVLSKC